MIIDITKNVAISINLMRKIVNIIVLFAILIFLVNAVTNNFIIQIIFINTMIN